jgi:Domain of unknown function (DUF4306)
VNSKNDLSVHRSTFFTRKTLYDRAIPPIPKRSLLKCFLKTYFSIDSLRQLVEILDQFGYFRYICRLKEVSHPTRQYMVSRTRIFRISCLTSKRFRRMEKRDLILKNCFAHPKGWFSNFLSIPIFNLRDFYFIEGGIVIFWFIIQFGLATILLFFSTAVAWYEGSAILDNPWEWKYSTPFSQMLYGEVHSDSDISQLDYFVYAAKFQPTFPVIMVISSLYLLVLIGYYFLNQHYKRFAYFLSILAGVLFLLSYFFINSPTTGGQIFFYIWLVSGVLCTVTAVSTYFQVLNRNTKKEM